MKRALNLLLLLVLCVGLAPFLSGCGTLRELLIPKEVRVPTPVPCLNAAERPRRPELWSTRQLIELDQDRRTHAAWATLKRYEAYVPALEAVVEGCSRIPVPAK